VVSKKEEKRIVQEYMNTTEEEDMEVVEEDMKTKQEDMEATEEEDMEVVEEDMKTKQEDMEVVEAIKCFLDPREITNQKSKKHLKAACQEIEAALEEEAAEEEAAEVEAT